MMFRYYIKDKCYLVLLFLFFYITLLLLLFAFKTKSEMILVISFFTFFFFLLSILIDYLRKKGFYTKLLFQIEQLDKSYLVLEMLEKPNFYEGRLLYQALYAINKSMIEVIKQYEYEIDDFKEYVEMWIHEVKIPISSLMLMFHNHKEKFDKKVLEQIRRLENDIEQILYYVRSENADKDYLINDVSLKKVITSVALKNKDDLLENKIDFRVSVKKEMVLTDSKWLEFILNQIINNSIKYKDEKKSSYISISVLEENEKLLLTIEDNGIGIKENDIKRVFEKSFTGYNGRIKTKSTGMGLFIAKKLCEKLGHKIMIESKEHEYTKVSIIFFKNTYYREVL